MSESNFTEHLKISKKEGCFGTAPVKDAYWFFNSSVLNRRNEILNTWHKVCVLHQLDKNINPLDYELVETNYQNETSWTFKKREKMMNEDKKSHENEKEKTKHV